MSELRVPPGYGIVRHIVQLSGDPEPMVITFGVGDDIGGAYDADDVVEAAHGAAAYLADIMSNSYTIPRAELLYRAATADPDDPFSVAVSTGAAWTGERTETAVPQNTAVLWHKRTAVAGRAGRGRMYIPGFPEGSITPTGALTGDLVAGATTAANAYLNHYKTLLAPLADLDAYLFHSIPVGALVAPLPSVITTLTVDPIVATQRRRLR